MRTLADVQNVKMNIVKAAPPNIAEIETVFPGVGNPERRIFFCYGDTIYNPSGVTIPLWLLAHEAVHSLQQTKCGIQLWWKWYLEQPYFRHEEELEAHRVEYEQYRAINNRSFSHRYLKDISQRLAGPLYGRVTTTRAARAAILAGAEDDLVSQRA